MSEKLRISAAGIAAGIVNGLFGAGGGMVLVPMLNAKSGIAEESRFGTSVLIMAPICVVALLVSLPWRLSLLQALPYLAGSAIGGIGAGIWGQKIPTVWLHRVFGGLILWGGIRYIW